MPEPMVELLDPVGALPNRRFPLVPRLGNVYGTSVGFRVQWTSFDVFMKRIQELLQERYGIDKITWMFTGSDGSSIGKRAARGRSDATVWAKEYDRVASASDWAIVGLAA